MTQPKAETGTSAGTKTGPKDRTQALRMDTDLK